MGNWSFINAAISLIAVYIAFSLLASWIQEQIVAGLQLRGKMLFDGLVQMLGDAPALAKTLCDHPAIDAPTDRSGARKPSYISAQQFTTALIGTLSQAKVVAADTKLDIADLRAQLASLGLSKPFLDNQLTALWNESQGEWNAFIIGINTWFNDQMDRVTGWYKRHTALILLNIAVVICALLNVDTIQILKVSNVAPLQVSSAASPQDVGKAVFANFTFGWGHKKCSQVVAGDGPSVAISCTPDDRDGLGWLIKALGILLTVFAVMLGAPFWFDLLQQLMKVNVRSSGPKPSSNPS